MTLNALNYSPYPHRNQMLIVYQSSDQCMPLFLARKPWKHKSIGPSSWTLQFFLFFFLLATFLSSRRLQGYTKHTLWYHRTASLWYHRTFSCKTFLIVVSPSFTDMGENRIPIPRTDLGHRIQPQKKHLQSSSWNRWQLHGRLFSPKGFLPFASKYCWYNFRIHDRDS